MRTRIVGIGFVVIVALVNTGALSQDSPMEPLQDGDAQLRTAVLDIEAEAVERARRDSHGQGRSREK